MSSDSPHGKFADIHFRIIAKLIEQTGQSVIFKDGTVVVTEFCPVEKDSLFGKKVIDSVNPLLWIPAASLKDKPFFSFIPTEFILIDFLNAHNVCSSVISVSVSYPQRLFANISASFASG